MDSRSFMVMIEIQICNDTGQTLTADNTVFTSLNMAKDGTKLDILKLAYSQWFTYTTTAEVLAVCKQNLYYELCLDSACSQTLTGSEVASMEPVTETIQISKESAYTNQTFYVRVTSSGGAKAQRQMVFSVCGTETVSNTNPSFSLHFDVYRYDGTENVITVQNAEFQLFTSSRAECPIYSYDTYRSSDGVTFTQYSGSIVKLNSIDDLEISTASREYNRTYYVGAMTQYSSSVAYFPVFVRVVDCR